MVLDLDDDHDHLNREPLNREHSPDITVRSAVIIAYIRSLRNLDGCYQTAILQCSCCRMLASGTVHARQRFDTKHLLRSG